MSRLVEFFQVFKVLKLTTSRNKQGILLNLFWEVSITQVGPRYEKKLKLKNILYKQIYRYSKQNTFI